MVNLYAPVALLNNFVKKHKLVLLNQNVCKKFVCTLMIWRINVKNAYKMPCVGDKGSGTAADTGRGEEGELG